jgi:hypothetical protein
MTTENKLKPYLLNNFIQTEKEGKLAMEVHSPQCPTCFNVDGRFTLKDDKHNATIIKIQSSATSGSILKCLCCEFEFKWSSGNVDYGILTIEHESQNDVLVPIEYFSKILGVDVYKYI